MSSSTETATAFDRGISPVMNILMFDKARDVLGFCPDPALQARIEELASKNTEGELSETERSEYEGYVRANKFIAVLQRQARRLLGPT